MRLERCIFLVKREEGKEFMACHRSRKGALFLNVTRGSPFLIDHNCSAPLSDLLVTSDVHLAGIAASEYEHGHPLSNKCCPAGSRRAFRGSSELPGPPALKILRVPAPEMA
jgi:hypothetical protein